MANYAVVHGRHGKLGYKTTPDGPDGAKKGDFPVRLPVEWTGINGTVADVLNEVIELKERILRELECVSQVHNFVEVTTAVASPTAISRKRSQ